MGDCSSSLAPWYRPRMSPPSSLATSREGLASTKSAIFFRRLANWGGRSSRARATSRSNCARRTDALAGPLLAGEVRSDQGLRLGNNLVPLHARVPRDRDEIVQEKHLTHARDSQQVT